MASGSAIASGSKSQIVAWAKARGRISSTEAADLTGLSTTYAGSILKSLAEHGSLKPGRDGTMGRGFYYVPAE